MALDGLIFDMDGTLVDTNAAHAAAWAEGLAEHGFVVPEGRIRPEIGKGGDLLLPTLLGEDMPDEQADAIRASIGEAFVRRASSTRFRLFDGATELLDALRGRGMRLALATSAQEADLDAIMDSARIDLRGHVDAVVTKGDVAASKPEPDVILAALEKLGLTAAQCAMVGDTPFDVTAARRAGVVTLGVLSSGLDDEDSLRERLLREGARQVYRDTGALLSQLDDALRIASPARARMTAALQRALLDAAAVAAAEGVAMGEPGHGCVVADGDGAVIAYAHDETQRAAHPAAHEVPAVMARLAGRRFDARDLLLACTREPCVMCTGAAMLAGIDTILFAKADPRNGGTQRVQPSVGNGLPLPRCVHVAA